MKRVLAIALFAVVSTTSFADTGHMRLIQQKGSPLRPVEIKRTNDLSARFSGRLWISGTFIARWPNGAANKNYPSPDYVLVPDRQSVAALPYFHLREPPYFHHYRVQQIQLANGVQALRLVATQRQVRQLLNRKVDQVTIVGSFLISDYSVGVECDAPWAKAKLREARVPPDTAALPAQVPEGC